VSRECHRAIARLQPFLLPFMLIRQKICFLVLFVTLIQIGITSNALGAFKQNRGYAI
jgi:hypothetical protein